MGNDPSQFSGTWYELYRTLSDGPEDMAIVDTSYFVGGFLVQSLFLHCMPVDRHPDSTHSRQQVCSFLCSRLPHISYGAGSTFQTATAVVSSPRVG